MAKSTAPIIEHIPRFLDNCKNIGLSNKTQENYFRYLNKFIIWLKENKKNNLLPHELTLADISDYKLYLASYRDKNGHSLKIATQYYHLIALRAILSYFEAKDVESIPWSQIKLPEAFKAEKRLNFLNFRQVEALLALPDIKTAVGLRDKIILEVLAAGGLKVNQLISLNRDSVENLPSIILPTIIKYLSFREDKNNALFINYRSRINVDKRLTARSVERIVQNYGKQIGLPFLITPEILRWARAQALLNEEVDIKEINNHGSIIVLNYKYSINKEKNINKISPIWKNIENNINKEIFWLKNTIPILPERYKENPPFFKCDDCILRKLAILITSGRVLATEIYAKNKKDLWNDASGKNIVKNSRHGQDLHKNIMDIIREYFENQNYEVLNEPILNYGRADLGVNLGKNKNIYIEVGTVSLFKLWYNFLTMKDATFLVVPSKDHLIEFNS